jgi:membrane protease YdiL (CAAX protease family)
MEQLGWWTVLFNCVLFSVFHLTSPWFWGHLLVYTFIWGIVTYMTRNVWIAAISHIIFNSYSRIIMLLTFTF